MKYDNERLIGRATEIFGSRTAFGRAMNWTSSQTSQKFGNVTKWTREDILKAAELLRISDEDLKDYFFTVQV